MTKKADIQDLAQLAELFDQYRIFYHKDSDIPAAEKFLKERIENKDSEIFVAGKRRCFSRFCSAISFIFLNKNEAVLAFE